MCRIKTILFICIFSSITNLYAQNLEEHIFYAPKVQDFTGLVFLNLEYKLLTNMEEAYLLGPGNIVLDTFSTKTSLLGNDQIFVLFVIDDHHFNVVTNNSSYLISIIDNRFKVIKHVKYSDRRKYGKFSHIYLVNDDELCIQHKSKKNNNTVIYRIYDEFENLKHIKEVSFSGIYNEYTGVVYSFPQIYYFNQTDLIAPNVFDNSLSFLDLGNGNLKKIELLPFDINKGSQTIFFDRSTRKYYMLRDEGKRDSKFHNFSLFSLDIKKNQYIKLKDFFYPQSAFRGGIFNGKFIMTGTFNEESAWFLIPISEIENYSGNLKLQINE